ncbi:NDR1/HIN1-like protein 13 [Gastrolobium bilobum]|uniref:NDR1/HIN1-like protein 13 n=1 Tax=Gastrolobium bilobum TaxID=150636 RepID=UPI002AB1F273|nr:NDR1/HIN1-like protein 13 [Gastrolobium bilobum]
MADRVHPRDSPPDSSELQMTSSQEAAVAPKALLPPPSEKPVPPPGTYVIQIPKDQVYRVPPPENARRYDQYTRRKHRQSRCCCCFCWLIGLIFILIVLLGIAAGVLYLVFRPKAPNYTIDSIAIRGINVTSLSSTAAISPEFDVTVRADNPNKKIGISYETDSSAEIFYNDVRLCNGALPAFFQPSNNVTVFETSLKGSGIELTSEDLKALLGAETKQEVPLTVRLRAPVKIKVGSVKTWKITVKVDCDVKVNDLTVKAKIVSKHCNYRVNLW